MPTQITVCEHEDFTGQSRRVFAVAAGANTDLSIDPGSTAGWVEWDEDENQSPGNFVNPGKKCATLATFAIDTPGDDVTLIVNSSVDCDLKFVDCGNGPA